MPDTPPIAPALTDEEWAAALHRGDFSYFALTEDVSDHARAALCLYGQPFGFTSEDVALLERLHRSHDLTDRDTAGWLDVSLSREEAERLRSLAARLAALLPRS